MRDQSAEIFRLSSELCAKYKSETNKNDSTIEFFRQMSGWIGKRSTPNCLWIVVLLEAIFQTLQHAIVRFADAEFSSEFENIEFVIDRSFIQRDEHLDFWKEWLRADLMKSSRASIMTIKQWPPDHPYRKKYMIHKGLYDYNDLFRNHTAFYDSKSTIGLQVADICANICYRYHRDKRSETRAYDMLRPRVMGKDGTEYATTERRSIAGRLAPELPEHAAPPGGGILRVRRAEPFLCSTIFSTDSKSRQRNSTAAVKTRSKLTVLLLPSLKRIRQRSSTQVPHADPLATFSNEKRSIEIALGTARFL